MHAAPGYRRISGWHQCSVGADEFYAIARRASRQRVTFADFSIIDCRLRRAVINIFTTMMRR